MRLQEYLEFDVFMQFSAFADPIATHICEIFDRNVKSKDVPGPFDYNREFKTKNNIVSVYAKDVGNKEWIIGFYLNGDVFTTPLKGKKHQDVIFSGVLDNVKYIIQQEELKDNIEFITFNTKDENKHLIKFYNNKYFQIYVENHFRFKLVGYIAGKAHQWKYKRNY